MRTKKWLTGLFVLTFMASITACGGGERDAASPSTDTTTGTKDSGTQEKLPRTCLILFKWMLLI